MRKVHYILPFLFLFTVQMPVKADSTSKIETFIHEAIDAGAFPGAVVVVGDRESVLYQQAFGTLTYDATAQHVEVHTIYDLASLTKVIAATPAVMHLYDRGKIDLQDPVSSYIDEFVNGQKADVTVRHLLLHTSGLPSWRDYYKEAENRKQMIQRVIETPLETVPGTHYLYSDLGMILLGEIVERISGYRLDEYVERYIYKPLGMDKTQFNPAPEKRDRIAPTEVDTLWRLELVHGVVHDENAYMLDGVAGHAGLFSTSSDLAAFAQMMLNDGSLEGVKIFEPETVRLFTRRSSDVVDRAYGWGVRSLDSYSSAGSKFSEDSYGHTGFTGTSIWIDPVQDIYVIFLSNRVHPDRANTRIVTIRPDLHDLVMVVFRNSDS